MTVFLRKPTSPAIPTPPVEDAPPVFDRRRLVAIRATPSRRGLLAGMRIRKKLIFLHTLFSLVLAGILLVALRPAVTEVIERAEVDQALVVLDALVPGLEAGHADAGLQRLTDHALVRSGDAAELGLSAASSSSAIAAGGRAVIGNSTEFGRCAVSYSPAHAGQPERFHLLTVRIETARSAVTRVYVLVVLSLVGVYGLVALALEVFVLPHAVYEPIRRMLAAERAVQEGRSESELIPVSAIPSDELGEIMASRNESIVKLRKQEAALASALSRLEEVAIDLRRKNHLIEAAQRNLADADRLASLGMMSAGIAHELNTPLAVLKGLVEKLNSDPMHAMQPAQAALMLRVVTRLERLGDSLLDFARVRPPQTRETGLRTVVQEATTLVRLDRESAEIELRNAVSESVVAECDPDRMVQVLVNLIRNAVEAVRSGGRGGIVSIEAESTRREGREWVSLRVRDDGPGIDPVILARLFEPFASTRLDSRGTGLGLAVAEGIVREHGGVILARNRTDGSGAIFEVMIPRRQVQDAPPEAVGERTEVGNRHPE